MFCQDARKIKKNDYRLQYGLGRSLEMQGKYSEAKKAYRFSISLKSNFHAPYAGLGAIALEQELYSTAEKYATDALRYSPYDARANFVLAEASLEPLIEFLRSLQVELQVARDEELKGHKE